MKKIILILMITSVLLNVNAQENKIELTGNVGIGTTNPSYALDITGTSKAIKLGNSENNILFRNNIGGTNEIRSYGLDLEIETRDSQDIFFNSNNGYRKLITIKGDGSGVGIGITKPASNLHVRGNELGKSINDQSILTTIEGSVVGNTSKFQVLNKRNGEGPKWHNTSLRLQRVVDVTPMSFIDFGIEGKTSSYGLAFGTRDGFGGTQNVRMVIEEDGNVGIGTTNPGLWKLAVNGKIRAKEIKVETGWADFVFYEDYELPTLEEVEIHIEEKGHLKDIPTAEEVEENGILVGEMNAKLLQKIEELTLYTIEQEKQLKDLQLRLEQVEAKK